MEKYSVVRIKGRQYRVSEGDKVLIDKISDKKVPVEVLLVVDGEKVEIGEPVLAKAKVGVKVLGDEKGKKMHVRKFKAKSRYRKKIGFRPVYTVLEIGKISS